MKKIILIILFICLVGCVPQQQTSMSEATTLTHEQVLQKFNQLKCGMTYEQIIGVLGNPTHITGIETDLMTDEVKGPPTDFNYDYQTYLITVKLHNLGKILNKFSLYNKTSESKTKIKEIDCNYTYEQTKKITNAIEEKKQIDAFMKKVNSLMGPV